MVFWSIRNDLGGLHFLYFALYVLHLLLSRKSSRSLIDPKTILEIKKHSTEARYAFLFEVVDIFILIFHYNRVPHTNPYISTVT